MSVRPVLVAITAALVVSLSSPAMARESKEEREALFRRFLVYSGLVVAFGPLLAWLLFVVPGWM